MLLLATQAFTKFLMMSQWSYCILQPPPWSIAILQKKQCHHPFLQYIIVLQYHAGDNCSSAGAHVVRSNCACTRLVNIATYSELYNAVNATNVKTILYSLSLVFSSLFIVYLFLLMVHLFLLMVIGISLPSQMQVMSGSHSVIQRITTTVL